MDDFTVPSSGPFSAGFDDLQLDTPWEFDMATIMDVLACDYSPTALPWDLDGTITAFDEVADVSELDPWAWQMHTPAFTDAVVAQQNIIGAYTGTEVSQEQLLYEATVHGGLDNGRMAPLDISRLLDLHGVDAHVHMGATVEDLMAELAQGHMVVMRGDAGALRNQDHPLEDFFRQSADHAIWIEDVDMSDPTDPKLAVRDSGDPDGTGKVYSLSDFTDRWEDSGFFYVATDNPPPEHLLKVSGFDAEQGVFAALVTFLTNLFSNFLEHLNIAVEMKAGPLRIGPLRIGFSTPLAKMDEAQRDALIRKL